MELGPYKTPLALAREPFTAGFWALCAPFLFPVIGSALLAFIWPAYTATIQDTSPDANAVGLVWAAFATFSLVQFAILSFWSERIGAGAFAGSVDTSANWLVAAILLGPPILLGPNLIIGQFFGGEQGWEYSTDVNEALFAPDNWGPAYLVYALLLAPMLEEVTYRGVALGALLSRNVPTVMAMVISTAAFTLPHLQYSLPALSVVFIAGMGFAWLRVASGSILVPILAHISANAMITFLASLSPPAG